MKGVILTNWEGGVMEEDNIKMIEEMSGVPVIAKVKRGDEILTCDPKVLADCFDEA